MATDIYYLSGIRQTKAVEKKSKIPKIIGVGLIIYLLKKKLGNE